MYYQNVTVQEVCSNFEKEYKAVTESIGFAFLPWKKVITVEGKDSQSFLDRMLSQKIIDLKPGESRHATLLQKTGYMIADLVVYCFTKDYFWLVVDETVREKTLEILNKFIVADDVSIHDISSSWKVLTILGKDSESFTKDKLKVDPKSFIVYKSSHALFPSFDVVIPQKSLIDLKGIEPIGFKTLNTLRIEAARAWYPFEIGEKTIPLEINFQDAISYDKGCYTGQETIAKATYRGHVNKVLVKLLIEGSELPQKDAEIFLDETKVGWVTSACYSPKYSKNIALGFIKYDFKDTKMRLAIKGKIDPCLRRDDSSRSGTPFTAHLTE